MRAEREPLSLRWVFAGVAILALLAGLALWLGHEAYPRVEPARIAPAALYAATFRDAAGQPQPLGRYEGRPLVLNFWATWCAPCREEMPGFARLQRRWEGRVQFVGLANDEPEKVRRFAAELGIAYPLLTGGADVDELARRLGDASGVLPFTVLLDGAGQVREQRVGPYTEPELDRKLAALAAPASR